MALVKGGRIKCTIIEYIIIEQIEMQESRHMRMYALVSYQLQYPDMTIRDFFAMASKELEEQEEELGYYD